MKQSYLESLISLAAQVELARSLSSVTNISDSTPTSTIHLEDSKAGKRSFSKINPHDTPVGINFANISAGIYPVHTTSVQGYISHIQEKFPAQ